MAGPKGPAAYFLMHFEMHVRTISKCIYFFRRVSYTLDKFIHFEVVQVLSTCSVDYALLTLSVKNSPM